MKIENNEKRTKISLTQLLIQFPTDESAEAWLINNRWGGKISCPRCNGSRVSVVANKKPMPYHCGGCRKYFSVKTKSVMDNSNIGCRSWVIALYLMTTNLKGIASTRLASELGITQKSAWHLGMRIRESFSVGDNQKLFGTIEADETFLGGKAINMSRQKRATTKKDEFKKTIVIGMKQRDTKQVIAFPIENTGSRTLQSAVRQNVLLGSNLMTDSYQGYNKLGTDYKHKSVNHSAWQYRHGDCYTNGIESFWSMLKRGYYGTFHQWSPKHTARYVNEFTGRHNKRQFDTLEQISMLATGMVGKKLGYKKLVA